MGDKARGASLNPESGSISPLRSYPKFEFLFRTPHRGENCPLPPLPPLSRYGFPPGFHSGFGPSVNSRTARAPALITPAMCTKSTFEISSDGW